MKMKMPAATAVSGLLLDSGPPRYGCDAPGAPSASPSPV